jgi:hypothetical protein
MAKKKASKKTSKKRPAKAKASATASAPAREDIPKGFTQMGGGYAPTWDVEKRAVLHGTVTGGVREVELTIGRKKQTRRCLEMTTLDGAERFTVWESAALGDFFDHVTEAGEGGEYYLRFEGYGKKKAGQNPPKLFTVAAKD